jgi:hypothetical protein
MSKINKRKTSPTHIQITSTKKKVKQLKQYQQTKLQLAIAAIDSKHISKRQASKQFDVPLTSLRRYISQKNQYSHYDQNININDVSLLNFEETESTDNHNLFPIVILSWSINTYGKVNIEIVYNEYNDDIKIISLLPITLTQTSGPPTIMTYEEEKAFCNWIITCSTLHIPTPKSICNQKASMILERRGSKFNTKTGLPSKKWWYGFYKRWPQVASRKPQPLSKGKALLTKEHVDAFFTDLHSLSNTVATEVSTYYW